MAKHNDKRRAKKKAEKERKRRIAVKKKLDNIKKSEQATNNKANEMKETLDSLQADIRSQVANIDDAKKICVVLEKFTQSIVVRRLDVPYLTDEIKERFRAIHDRIVNTLKRIQDIRNKFVETAIKIQNPGALRPDIESIQKYSEVINGAQELMNMQSSLVDFGAECGQIIRDIDKLVKDSEELRKQNGDFSIMPIATPEELKFLGLNFNYETYEFENKDGGDIEVPYVETTTDENKEKEQIVEKTDNEETIEEAVIINDVENISEETEHEENNTAESEITVESIEEEIKE